jgi:hypothetical protein
MHAALPAGKIEVQVPQPRDGRENDQSGGRPEEARHGPKRKKYTSKAATFVVKLPAYGQSQSVTLKSNGFLVVNFGV